MNARRNHGNRGVALLLVLLFITLLSVVIIEFLYEMRVEATLASNHVNRFEAGIAARSAVAAGISLLEQDFVNLDGVSGPEFDAFTDVWASGLPMQDLNGALMRATIADEFGKLNLNALLLGEEQAPNEALIEVFRALFIARGAEMDPVDAILDWMDYDQDVRPTGAEADDYLAQEYAMGCKNAPFDSIEELLLVRGVTPELFFGDPEQGFLPLTELMTVHGHRRGRVNANTAPAEVLDAIGEAQGRAGLGDVVTRARDEAVFQTVEDLQARGILDLESGNNPFLVAGRVFRIRGDGMKQGAKVRVEAFVRRDSGGGFRVRDWRVLQ
jgi:general secretion pathway protein K